MIDNDASTAGATLARQHAPADPVAAAGRLGRLGPLLAVINIGWALPSAAGGTLLQALLAQQRGADKVGSLAVLTTIGAVIAVVSTVVAGAWSDRTRSRFGRRSPWILGGAVASATGLALTGVLTWFPAQIVAFALFQGGLNAMLAAVSALLPDRVAGSALGRASASAGIGYLVGTAVGGVAASAAIGVPARGLMIVPWTMVVAALLLVLLVRGRSSRDDRRGTTSARAVLRSLLPPRDRDFLLAFAGRFCVILGLTVIVFYQLYVFTDFLRVDTAAAARHIALGTALLGAAALIATVAGGLLSDRLGRRRPLVVFASLLIAAAAVPVAVAPSVASLMTFYVVGGAGYGLYLSVDQALMVQVLPTSGAAAKELGMLNVANSAPSVIAPPIAAAVVSILGFHGLFLFAVAVAVLGGGCVGLIRRVR
jgi:MFS family permease